MRLSLLSFLFFPPWPATGAPPCGPSGSCCRCVKIGLLKTLRLVLRCFALKTDFTQCQHLEPPFQFPPCPQSTFHPVPTTQIPFSTAPMPSKHISPSANTSRPLFNCPHALKTHFTQCEHLKPPFQVPPCPQNKFHPMPTPQTPFSAAPVPSKHISAHCQHLKPPLQLPPCPPNTFHRVPTPEARFATARMPSKHILPSANTSSPLFNSPHALKTHFTQGQHLKPPFQLPPCRQNTFHPVTTPETPCATARMPAKNISPSSNTSNPLFNSPRDLKTNFTQCQHLKPPFRMLPCPRNTFRPVPTHQGPFPTAPTPSKHISASANTSNLLFNCPHALKTHNTRCQHLKPPFQLPLCPPNTLHPVTTPKTPFATARMPRKHI